MGLFSKLFKKSDRIYITNDDNIYNLSEDKSKIDKLIEEKGPILNNLSINPEYIVRMIYYIESLYRSGFNIIKDKKDLIECINKDCVLFEMMIDLPPRALENGRNSIYAQLHQNQLFVTTGDILDNPGYIWYISKSILNEKSFETLKHTQFKDYADFKEYVSFIEVYVSLINIYTKNKFEKKLRSYIFNRLNKIYSGLIMILSKVITDTTKTKDNYIRDLFNKRELGAINLGKIFIGYQNMNDNIDRVSVVVFDTEDYEQKSLTTLYLDLHNKVREIEYIPKND